MRKLSGLTKYGNITLKYGISVGVPARSISSTGTRQCRPDSVLEQRKRITIVVQDEAGQDKTRFVITDAWPVKYDPSDLNAKGNEVMIEMLEFANEGIERKMSVRRTP